MGITAGTGQASDVRVGTCLIELVVSAGEFGPQAEPALRQLRSALEAGQQLPAEGLTGPILRTGMAVTQEFGKLDITLRALVSTDDLLQGALLGAQHLRDVVDQVERAEGLPASFQEQSVRASWS